MDSNPPDMTICDRCGNEVPNADITEVDGRCLCPDCCIVTGDAE